MKTAAKICIVLACLALLAAGAYWLTSYLSVSFEITRFPASEQRERFEEIKKGVAGGAYEDVSSLGSIEEYSFVTVRAELGSYSPFKTEWITLSVDPLEGDVLTVSSNTWVKEMRSFGKSEGDEALYVTILTKSAETQRSGKLEYYIFGKYRVKYLDD